MVFVACIVLAIEGLIAIWMGWALSRVCRAARQEISEATTSFASLIQQYHVDALQAGIRAQQMETVARQAISQIAASAVVATESIGAVSAETMRGVETAAVQTLLEVQKPRPPHGPVK